MWASWDAGLSWDPAILTVDLQDLRSVFVGGSQGHMVHSTSVGHTVILPVHLEPQRTLHCKCLATGIDLFGTWEKWIWTA